MRITLEEILDAMPVLNELSGQKLPAVISFSLAKLIRNLRVEADAFEQTRIALVKNLGQETENKEYVVKKENLEDFSSQMKQLLNTVVDIEVDKIDLNSFETSNLQMTPNEMMKIDFLFKRA